jgi:hypothetical protein
MHLPNCRIGTTACTWMEGVPRGCFFRLPGQDLLSRLHISFRRSAKRAPRWIVRQ